MRYLALLLTVIPLPAAEIAVLRSGAVLRADRIEKTAEKVVLYSAGGRTELLPGDIDSFEVVSEAPVAARVDATPPPQAASATTQRSRLPVRELLNGAAERHGVPAAFVRSVAAAESAFRVDAVSPKGAIGVMQLMPGTASKLKADPRDAAQNIDAGTRLLRDLLLKYRNQPNPVRRALAAYNAGESAVGKYGGVPPYRETQQYVERVLQRYWREVREQ